MLGIWVRFQVGPWSHAYWTPMSEVRTAVPQRCKQGDYVTCWLWHRGPVSRQRVEGMPRIFLTREPWTPFWDGGVPRLEKMDLYIDWMFILSNSKRDEGESGLSNNVPMPATPLALESNHQIFTEWLTPPLLIQHPSNLCLRFIMCEYKEHVARWRRGQLS